VIQPKTFAYEERKRVAHVTLDRPDRLNSLTFESYRELAQTFRALASRDEVRAVMITGKGRGFCSGGDREDIIAKLFARNSQGVTEFAELTCELIAAMRDCPRPIVAAINGACVGAGVIVAMASDFRYAVPEAKFGFVFVKVGISGADMGATFLLPQIVGLTKATELLMTGDLFDAAEAKRIGFVNDVVPAERLLEVSTAMAERLAAGPGFGLSITKKMLNQQMGASLWQALAAEAQAQALCMLHPDFKEAYEALKAKREPRFA
jgi:enoyl-CoA hydratase/carnithine racemase